MTRMRKFLMAGAVLALVGVTACSDDVVGPVPDREFDTQAFLKDWTAQREAAPDTAERYVPNRKYER